MKEVARGTKEEPNARDIKVSDIKKTDGAHLEKAALCSICKKAATQLVDGEPSCADHIEQVYEHQLKDYTRARLLNNEWRKP